MTWTLVLVVRWIALCHCGRSNCWRRIFGGEECCSVMVVSGEDEISFCVGYLGESGGS